MPLTRKTRNSGSSIVVTIPCQLIEAYDIHFGGSVQIIPLKNGEIKIKKIDTNHPYEDKNLKEKIQKKTR